VHLKTYNLSQYIALVSPLLHHTKQCGTSQIANLLPPLFKRLDNMGRDRTISLNTTVKLYEEFEGSFTFGQKHSYK
jgi:hypothetical protein